MGGISEETAACDWWSLGAILFELLTGTVSQKVQKKNVIFVAKVLWDVCRCLGFQLSHTLYGRARLCAIVRASLYVFEFVCVVCVCVCVCVCEVRLGCRLLLWFSGSARGVGVTFSPSLSSICWARGSALPGLSLLAPGVALGSLSTPIRGLRGR